MIDGRNATTRRIRLQVVRDRTWMLCKYVAIKRPPDGQVFVLAAHPYHSAPSSHKHYIRHNTLNVASARPLGQRYWEIITLLSGSPVRDIRYWPSFHLGNRRALCLYVRRRHPDPRHRTVVFCTHVRPSCIECHDHDQPNDHRNGTATAKHNCRVTILTLL